MNRLVVCFALTIANLTVEPSSGLAQDYYCPQILEGQMGGTFYYWCQDCGNNGCTAYCMVATGSSFSGTLGANCSACGGGCTSGLTRRAPKDAKPAKNTPPDFDIQAAEDPDDGHWKSKGTNFDQYDPNTNKYGLQIPPNAVKTKDLILWINDNRGNGHPHYFRCVELQHQLTPTFTLIWRFGQELPHGTNYGGNTPIPGSCTLKHNFYHHISYDVDGTGNFISFDCNSIDDMRHQ